MNTAVCLSQPGPLKVHNQARGLADKGKRSTVFVNVRSGDFRPRDGTIFIILIIIIGMPKLTGSHGERARKAAMTVEVYVESIDQDSLMSIEWY